MTNIENEPQPVPVLSDFSFILKIYPIWVLFVSFIQRNILNIYFTKKWFILNWYNLLNKWIYFKQCKSTEILVYELKMSTLTMFLTMRL